MQKKEGEHFPPPPPSGVTGPDLIFIFFAHHIKQTFRNVFHYVGFDTFAVFVNHNSFNRGDRYFNLEEISSDHNLDRTK